ncbi:MAG: glycosyltransferase [Luminiphilus sp.]|jgi:GT2 family glycosyltransferase|nr:glycosyltransferase [Luminiphilus sp.]
MAMTNATATNEQLPSLSAAVVLHHSSLQQLEAMVTSLGTAAGFMGGHLPLYLIDQSQSAVYSDAVQALSRKVAAESSLRLQYIARESNDGYGAGHNTVLDKALGDYHLILNPDVELSENALLKVMHSLRDHPDVTIMAPRGANELGNEEHLAKRYPSVLVLLLRALGLPLLSRCFSERLASYELRDLSHEGGLQDVPLLSGCCMVARSDALRAVGGFNEQFFMYFEDYDLCMRMASIGRVVRDPDVRIIHHGGGAARKGLRHIIWFMSGGIRFFRTWGWRWV